MTNRGRSEQSSSYGEQAARTTPERRVLLAAGEGAGTAVGKCHEVAGIPGLGQRPMHETPMNRTAARGELLSWGSAAAMVRHPAARNRRRMLLRNAATARGGGGGVVATPNMPITSILPDEGWAPLLGIIVRECPAASVIEVNTAGMQALAQRMLGDVGRQDVTVELRPPRLVPLPPAPGG